MHTVTLIVVGIITSVAAAGWFFVGYFKGYDAGNKGGKKANDDFWKLVETTGKTEAILLDREKDYKAIIQRQNQELSDFYLALSAARARLMQVDPEYGQKFKEVVPPKSEMN